MLKQTALYDLHLEQKARMVPFAGWEMPLHYGSQLDEHKAVREAAGIFDVSHMGIVDIIGPDAKAYLNHLLANDVGKLQKEGRALYSCLLNEVGGIIDDLILYYLGPARYRLVINAARRDLDLNWMHLHTQGYEVDIKERLELCMIALQGPKAQDYLLSELREHCQEQVEGLKYFSAIQCLELFIARTGYTGEEGFEIILPEKAAQQLWKALVTAGVKPCGLAARDSLRLEAGLNLYGTDMDENISPLEAGLEWTLAWEPKDRDFIGRAALETLAKDPQQRRFVGLVMDAKGVLRSGMKLFEAQRQVGEITSGGYSSIMNKAIGMARIQRDAAKTLEVEIRGKRLPIRQVSLPFIRKGKILVE